MQWKRGAAMTAKDDGLWDPRASASWKGAGDEGRHQAHAEPRLSVPRIRASAGRRPRHCAQVREVILPLVGGGGGWICFARGCSAAAPRWANPPPSCHWPWSTPRAAPATTARVPPERGQCEQPRPCGCASALSELIYCASERAEVKVHPARVHRTCGVHGHWSPARCVRRGMLLGAHRTREVAFWASIALGESESWL